MNLRYRVLIAAATLVLLSPVAFGRVNRWTSSGPFGVSITSLAIDPTNPEIVYAGSGRAVFRSRDGGSSWASSTFSSGPIIWGLSGLAIHPLSSSTIFAALRGGVFKSTDAGIRWTAVGPPIPNAHAYDVVLDPSSPTTLLAGTNGGTFRSTDGGSSWARVLASTIYDLVFAPQAPSTVVGTEISNYYYPYYPTTLWRSTDRGVNWSQASNFTFLKISPGALAIDPTNSTTLYAGGSHAGVQKSVDLGSTWRRHDSDLGEDSVSALVIDPRNPSTMYAAAGGRIRRSIDGGVSWTEFNTGAGSRGLGVLAIDRTGTRLYAGTSGEGVFDYQIFAGALDLSVGTDATSRLLFVDLDNRATLRSFDDSGQSSGSAPGGRFEGWYGAAVADGPDGLTRLLWNHLDGSAALWLLGPTGKLTSYRYGPAAGWTAVDVSVDRDNTTHTLWTNTDGRTGLLSALVSGAVVRSTTFGPYSGWLARSIADGTDGLTRLLWSNTDGRIGLSLVDTGTIVATYRFTPPSGWTARDVTVAADNRARILLVHADGRAALWTVDNSGVVTNSEASYERSVAGQTATRISAGADGLTRLLWTSPEGTGTLWLLSLGNVLQSSFGFGQS